MRILILSQEHPFDPQQVATGNAIRTDQLYRGLRAAGHEVEQLVLGADGELGFNSADGLRGQLQRRRPDVLLVSYWELLSLLPFDLACPVVLDFLAPRPLEALFERPEQVGGMLRRLRIALARCDLLLVGNEDQKSLLAYWLLEAGFDLRANDPIRVVPLAAKVIPTPDRPDPSEQLRIVSGGVNWPWRQDSALDQALDETLDTLRAAGETRLDRVDIAGRYRWHEDSAATGLSHWADWSRLLAHAHLGLELGAQNLERRYSQSFRALDYLRHGVPILCTPGQPLAQAVTQHGAGWVIETADELAPLLQGLLDHPERWHEASDGARALLAARHDPDRALAPLLHWLETPAKAPRLPGYGLPEPDPPVLGVPPLRERLGRRYRLARRIALHRLMRPKSTERRHVVLVSRHDLFPTDHGGAVKIVETARGLSRHDRDVFIVTHDRRRYWQVRDGEIEERRLPRWLAFTARPEPWVKLDHYTKDIPESNAFLYQPLSDGSFFWRALWVAARHDAGVLQAEFPAYALPCLQAGEVLDIPTVLVEHNVEYDRLRAQVPELSQAQYERFRDIEIDLCNRMDAVICVSDNDRQKLAEDGVHPGRLHTIPHGIDLAAYDNATPEPVRERYHIPDQAPLLVYHGTFAYPPNRDALQMLADEILPGLLERGIEAHVLAVGHQPPSETPHPAIHCTGSVASMAPWLKAADLAVVPLREGGGTRMKIIDDFAAGLAVVATAKGIEGIPASDGQEALIRDDWPSFCDAVATLVHDPAQREEIAAAGRRLAEGLDWSAIGARYLRLFATL